MASLPDMPDGCAGVMSRSKYNSWNNSLIAVPSGPKTALSCTK